MKSFRSIVITGAFDGIGEALALDYAAPGIALALSGRDAVRLQAVAEACRARARSSSGHGRCCRRERWLPADQVYDAHPSIW